MNVNEMRELLGHDVLLLHCKSKTKRPVGKWKDLTVGAMANATYLAKLETGNIGVVLGQRSGGLCSLDIDSDNEFGAFIELNDGICQTLCTRGARGGNLWWRLTGSYPSLTTLKKAGAACRISEALQLNRDRVDFTEKALVFETLKQRERGRYRAVPIPDALVELFERLLAEQPPGVSVWPYSRTTAYRLIKRRMADAKIAGVKASPKGLRHSFAIACLSRGIPLTTIKKWLGHARLETTAIYLDAGGDEERELAKRLW